MVYKVADIGVDMVADMVVDMVADKKRGRHGVVHGGDINIIIHMEIKFGERVGHGACLIGPKLF